MIERQAEQPQKPLAALDTSVASLFLDTRAVDSGYADLLRDYEYALPMATYAELRQGSMIAGWIGSKRQGLEKFLSDATLLSTTGATAKQWASLRFECRRRGIGNTENDAWVAAAALEMNLPLVSNDRIHLIMQAAVPQLRVLSLLSV